MRIPETKIEEIRAAANIVDVISEFVRLRKRGKNYIGLCPFHSEKTPSFTVSDEKQIFHCFGCHNGGNVYKFLMDYEKISFVEAVQSVADKIGITIDFEESQHPEKQDELEILFDVNVFAARYFSDNLLNKPEGETGRKYFQQRKIKLQTMRAFGLGYSSPQRDGFTEYAKDKINLEKAIQLGLIIKGNEGRLFDRFSGRIMFPIFSPNGRVIGFGGRILNPQDNTAKYLNSPESPVYYKGRTLYGLSHGKDEIRRLNKVIMVEGYMDLISLYQAGVKNVVAVSGTALTDEQVQLLSRYTKNVVLLFDADTAGIKASMRSIEILLKKDFDIRIVSLPPGEDPDSFVNTYGKEKFDDLIKQAVNFLEYQTRIYQEQGYFDDPNKTVEAIRELVHPISLIDDELKRNILIKTIAKNFGLREKLLEQELDKVISVQKKKPEAESLKIQLKKKEVSTRTQPEAQRNEIEVIRLLLEENNKIIEFIMAHVASEEFSPGVIRDAATLVYDHYNQYEFFELASVIDEVENEELKQFLLKCALEDHSISRKWEKDNPNPDTSGILVKMATDTVRKFKLMQIDRLIKDTSEQLKSASSEDEVVQYLKTLEEFKSDKMNLSKELV